MFLEHLDLSLPLFWSRDDILSAEECQELLSRVEAGQWKRSTVNSGTGRVVDNRVRNNDLAILEDAALARSLRERLGDAIPDKFREMEVFGIGPKMRVYRYQPGQYFGAHQDQFYRGPAQNGRPIGSRLTLLVYLNEGFVGGETAFLENDGLVEPRTGRVLLFQHAVVHEGRRVVEGVKYLLRSDVFFFED